MSDKHIHYRAGYKYQLDKDYRMGTDIKPPDDINLKFIGLNKKGDLLVREGYAWDGVSGPVIDTKNNLRASLVHDAFYQLMREEELDGEKFKDKSDRLFQEMCEKDGVWKLIAFIYYKALQRYGEPSTDPRNARKIKSAP